MVPMLAQAARPMSGFWAQPRSILYILTGLAAHIRCAAVNLAFLGRPKIQRIDIALFRIGAWLNQQSVILILLVAVK
jgi:hypothetical protein